MADDARSDLLKGLGIKRRRGSDGAEATVQAADAPDGAASDVGEASDATATDPPVADAAPPADAAPATDARDEAPARDKGLGIRRRSGPTATPSSSPASAGGGGSTGLGFKRRGESNRQAPAADSGQAQGASDAAGASDEEDDDYVDPLAAVRSRLGNDEVAVMLANHLRTRPDLIGLLPPRVFDLKRTHGYYGGDGRKGRKITIGWEPAFVLYTIPAYPDGMPTFTKDWKLIEPGPNKQPRFVEDGFVVPARLNRLGEWYVYIVFRSDGQPLEAAAPEPEAQPKRGKTDDGPRGLGIKRRR